MPTPSLKSHIAKLALEHPELRDQLVPLLREGAAPWSHLPKGWDDESVRKFWDTMTGDVKHKVTKCIKEMSGSDITDPGAFCASLADKMEPGWRSRREGSSVDDWVREQAKAKGELYWTKRRRNTIAITPTDGVYEIIKVSDPKYADGHPYRVDFLGHRATQYEGIGVADSPREAKQIIRDDFKRNSSKRASQDRQAARSLNVANTPLKKARDYADKVFAGYGTSLDAVLPDFDRHYLLLQKKVARAPAIPRIKMPVIEPGDMDLFNKRLNEGKLDIFKPYAKGKLVNPKDTALEPGEEWVELGVKDGDPNDDVVRGKRAKVNVIKLLPTQNEIWLENVIPNIAKFGKAGPGSPILKAPVIMSAEGYILDGHHRYAQAMLADPGLALSGLYIPLDIDNLLEIGRSYGEAIGNKPKQASVPSTTRKATIYFKGPLGISKTEGHLTSVDAGGAGGMVNYIPKGGRRERGIMTYYSPFIMVVEGWNKPDPDTAFEEIGEGKTPGVSLSKGKYMSADPRWVSDFMDAIGKRMRPLVLFEDGKLKKLDPSVPKNVGREATVRRELVKLAYNNPELRPKLMPLLKQAAKAVSPRARSGTRVEIQANPASRALYRGLPPDGTQGTVTPVAGPGGKMTYMPGPGGGLLYIQFDDGTFMGVSPNDLIKP